MNIKISFRDLSNLIYQTEMDDEEIYILTDIADSLATEMHEEYKGRYDICTDEFIEYYNGNIFEVPVYDDNSKRTNVDISKTCYFESIKRFIRLARNNVTRLYSIEGVKYFADTDETGILFKAYNPIAEV